MSDVVIRVKNVGKEYRLGMISHGTLYRDLQSGWAKAWGREDPNARVDTGTSVPVKNTSDRFRALEDISFDVEQGEVLGIIGRNGAGKSTLLKIISRVTAPTTGSIKIRGRVASLLEVGTGFHPELSGRENVFLNGAILGMRKREIEQKFNEIVQFAEIDRFIDTPVKRYSSGMYVRLAFAVAAHLEPEILVVDEVLAVGDTSFQKKCLGKMGDVAHEGRTVLFVSHNMAAIRQLCQSCICLDKGRLREKGQTNTVVENYLAVSSAETTASLINPDETRDFHLARIRIIDTQGREISECNCDYPIIIEMMFRIKKKVPGLNGYLIVQGNDGTNVMESDSFDAGPNTLDDLGPGMHKFQVHIPARTLGPGNYRLYLNFYNGFGYSVFPPGFYCPFVVFDETTSRGNKRIGYFSTKLTWKNCLE